MGEMVERVAKAIYAAEHGTEYQDGTPVRPSPDEWDVLLTCARAAIAAMREPTEAMLKAAHSACDENGHVLIASSNRAMIDEALKP